MLSDYLPHLIRLGGRLGFVHTVRDTDGGVVRVLDVGGVYQSATYLDERWASPVFNYYKSFDVVFEAIPEACSLLMIGGGGFAWPKHLLEEVAPELLQKDELHLDVVELEGAVIKAARRWFFLDRLIERHPKSLNVIEADGRVFLETFSGCYDAIVLDAFAGNKPVRALASVEAFEAAKRCLAQNGAVLSNVVSNDGGQDVEFLRNLVATAKSVFEHVQVIACEDDPFAAEDNYLLVASDAPLNLEGAIAYDEDFLGEILRD